MIPRREPQGSRPASPSGTPSSSAHQPRAAIAALIDEPFEWGVLSVSAIVLLLAMLLEVREGVQVIVPWFNRPLPEVCAFRRLFDVPCLGCGLTRSIISMGHARWSMAWAYHPGGPLLFVALALQIPFRALRLRQIRKRLRLSSPTWANAPLMLAFAAIFFFGFIRMFR